jgi:hypothetical protein
MQWHTSGAYGALSHNGASVAGIGNNEMRADPSHRPFKAGTVSFIAAANAAGSIIEGSIESKRPIVGI